ncbi:MAG: mercury resistance system periplasmic binding protein MerP [Lysobacter sp.]|nr:mercury resistance system periplasmic binding protein MerP [Lysobacter sp.]MDQ3269568.1 mercury resistance system periplasmic binding protein MerP [Pseudomonadota bacterium]
MRNPFVALSAPLLFAAAALAPASAAERTVTLSVPGMTCAACPITVKKALNGVDGVRRVAVTYEPREAVVTYDDAVTDVQALAKASENAGYPAVLKK